MPASPASSGGTDAGFGVYVHWPFCESKCPYCDFNSHVSETIDQAHWRQAYATEIGYAAAELSEGGGPTVTSIFFGGGTPSLAEPETIATVIGAIRASFRLANDIEITLEANPSSVEAGRFRSYADVGVNRVSLGVQSLDDEALRFLGRRHDRGQAIRALETAATVFDRRSFDLICARPGQSPKSWSTELDEALGLAGDHLSIYQLTIESGTPFARDGVPAADEETGAAIFELTQARLADAGLPAYEISNHARAGSACRHNLTYWRGGGYLGIGPGAHGRLRTPDGWRAEHRIHNPGRWLDAVGQHGHGTAKTFALSPADRAVEIVMTGLRLNGGLPEADVRSATGLGFGDVLDRAALERLIAGGLVEKMPDGIRATAEGRLRLNGVIGALLGGAP